MSMKSRFTAAAIGASVAAISPAKAQDSFIIDYSYFGLRHCSQVPLAENWWVQDCSVDYSGSGDYLVKRFFERELIQIRVKPAPIIKLADPDYRASMG